MERRTLLSAMASLGALVPAWSDVELQVRPEVETYWAEVPPGARLWGLAIFLADEPVEFTVAAGKEVTTIRGRYDGQRTHEYSWHNTTGRPQQVAVRAIALAGGRELPASKVQFIAEQNVYVAFGQRATPQKPSDRTGAYPYQAVLVGFITFSE
jgi:hypothetical protein